jgi:hypothetical protein
VVPERKKLEKKAIVFDVVAVLWTEGGAPELRLVPDLSKNKTKLIDSHAERVQNTVRPLVSMKKNYESKPS